MKHIELITVDAPGHLQPFPTAHFESPLVADIYIGFHGWSTGYAVKPVLKTIQIIESMDDIKALDRQRTQTRLLTSALNKLETEEFEALRAHIVAEHVAWIGQRAKALNTPEVGYQNLSDLTDR